MASDRRRTAVVLAGAVVAVVLAAAGVALLDDDDGVRSGGILFGAAPGARAGETRLQALARVEQQTGRPLAVVRVYKRWDSVFPDALDTLLARNGQVPFVSLKPQFDEPPSGRSSAIRWRTIADAPPRGQVYREIVSWADRLKRYGHPMYFAFHHEPDNETARFGTPADFIDAWRRVVTVFRDRGVVNVRFAWTLTAFAFQGSGARAASFYPGDGFVDVVAADGYNFSDCRGPDIGWKPVDEVFAGFRSFAAEHPQEGVVIGEWGSVEDPDDPTRKAEWLDDARVAFAGPAWQRLEAVVYWNSASEKYEGCPYWVDSSSATLDAWRRMAADPVFTATGLPGAAELAG